MKKELKINIDDVLTVARKLSCSEGRIPYTYHHDYLRCNVSKFREYSRSDIALLKTFEDNELYSMALVEILRNNSLPEIISILSQSDLNICKRAIKNR